MVSRRRSEIKSLLRFITAATSLSSAKGAAPLIQNPDKFRGRFVSESRDPEEIGAALCRPLLAGTGNGSFFFVNVSKLDSETAKNSQTVLFTNYFKLFRV